MKKPRRSREQPPHPGEALAAHIESEGVTVSAAAKCLHVARQTLYRIMWGKQSLTAEMALRLGTAFSTGPWYWLDMQLKYDVWQAERRYKGRKIPHISELKRKTRRRPR